MTYREAKYTGDDFVGATRKFYEKTAYVGSLGRKEEEVHDVDVLVVPKGKWDEAAQKQWVDTVEEGGGHVTKFGGEEAYLDWEGTQVNVYFTTEKEWGAAFIARIGPDIHNIALATVAKNRGWHLNRHGLFDKDGHHLPGTETAAEIFDKLGHTKEDCETRKEIGI
jgi:DNA polymerase/3'-5' exonuclease PolX